MSTPPDPQKLREGEAAASEAFRRLLRAHICGYFNKESQVHDVTQDALLDLLAKLEAGAEPKHPEYWALNAANNAVRRELTRLRRRAIEYQSQLHGYGQDDGADHAELLDAREDLRKINALLADCDEVPFRALTAAVEGRNHREIAEELGISPGAARMTLARARSELSGRFTARQKIDHLMWLARRAGLIEAPQPADEAAPGSSSSS
ncbi:RNA polymerase sigma factor [Enhygromyxa salina]|uniref:RNA polymerase sigma factor n=1 Tax=Enhygromyxa salina TaxID=215803 RepID=A0A2S9YSK3_9BACT|nr:sigma-70 family RNA polymerase sigma factor [Enhygromyxa salina]PRQ08081.1 RNA polymerase sigma factor [Enhygromyxa salina]